MTRALVAPSEGIERTFSGAVLPKPGGSGRLLAQYSVRLGSALLHHRAEIAERASRIEAEAASRLKSEFIANVSHELRTPLNAIIGFAKIIKESEAKPLEAAQLAEYSSFIFDSANGLLGIVNDIITISKLQNGTLHLHRELVYPDEFVEACAHWAEAQVAGNGKQFFHVADTNLLPVEADAEHLKLVLMRLLRNAMTFTRADGRIVLAAKAGPGGSAIFTVSDNGIGMSEKEIETALRSFGQNDQRLNREHGGTGLGLPIAKAVVEKMGGRLMLRSKPDEGTDAIVVLPASGQGSSGNYGQ